MFERAKIELEAEVVDGQLVLRLPVGVETAVQVQNNEILVNIALSSISKIEDRMTCYENISGFMQHPSTIG